jgi:hypothetical protein
MINRRFAVTLRLSLRPRYDIKGFASKRQPSQSENCPHQDRGLLNTREYAQVRAAHTDDALELSTLFRGTVGT